MIMNGYGVTLLNMFFKDIFWEDNLTDIIIDYMKHDTKDEHTRATYVQTHSNNESNKYNICSMNTYYVVKKRNDPIRNIFQIDQYFEHEFVIRKNTSYAKYLLNNFRLYCKQIIFVFRRHPNSLIHEIDVKKSLLDIVINCTVDMNGMVEIYDRNKLTRIDKYMWDTPISEYPYILSHTINHAI